MKNDPISNILHNISKKEPKTIIQQMVKLQEESGEFAVAVLQNHGLKGSGTKSLSAINDNILEEGVDVMIVVLSILGAYKFTEKDVYSRMEDKIKKWKKQINKKK